jgi:hypothetical protein
MGFFEVLIRVTELLQREGCISYRAIKREWLGVEAPYSLSSKNPRSAAYVWSGISSGR